MLDLVLQTPTPATGNDFISLLYFATSGLIVLGIDMLRRWLQHRMSLWEAQHPIPEDDDD